MEGDERHETNEHLAKLVKKAEAEKKAKLEKDMGASSSRELSTGSGIKRTSTRMMGTP